MVWRMRHNAKKSPVSFTDRRALSLLADVDERSIAKLLAGGDVRGRAGDRARRVLTEAGLLPAPKDGAK